MQIFRKDNPNIPLHPTAVGFKTENEERKDREPFMVTYIKNSDDNNSLYSRYRRELVLEDYEEFEGKGKSKISHFWGTFIPYLLNRYPI